MVGLEIGEVYRFMSWQLHANQAGLARGSRSTTYSFPTPKTSPSRTKRKGRSQITMSIFLATRISKASPKPSAIRNGFVCLRCQYSTEPPPPSPLLLKLRGDLKTAMKSKDTNRLNVVKGVLNEIANAAKTNTPLKTDMQILGLLRKRTSAAQQASKEFSDAGRADLQEKEDSQIAILNEYAGGVETMGAEEVKDIVAKAIEEMKNAGAKMSAGDVMKRLLAPGGELDGKPVEKAQVARFAKDLVSAQN